MTQLLVFSVVLSLLLLLLLLLLAPTDGLQPPQTQPNPRPPVTTFPKPSPTNQPLSDPAQEFLNAHNQARADVGVGPLRWSPALANATARLTMYQRVKNNCKFADVSSDKIKYGATQLWARGQAVSPAAAVAAWVAEKKYYNHATDSCAPNHQCGVYKQVVWRKSVELGCAQATCAKDGSSLTICFYNPPGNVIGESPY